MKFTNIISLITFASGLVYAKLDQCSELESSVTSFERFICENDENGEIVKLYVFYIFILLLLLLF